MAVVAKDNAADRAIGRANLAELLQTAIRSSLESRQRTTGRVQALVDAVQDGIGVVQRQPRRVVRAALRHRDGAQFLDARVLAMGVVESCDRLRVGRDVDQAGRGEVAGAEQGRDQALLEIMTRRHCIRDSIDEGKKKLIRENRQPSRIYTEKRERRIKKNRLRHGYSLIYWIGIVLPPRKSLRRSAYNADPR